MKNIFFRLAILSFFILSCRQKNIPYKKSYFDFDSLLKAQIQLIEKNKATMIKKTSLNGMSDSVSVNAVNWTNELDPFHHLDVINKPMYKGHYRVTETNDSLSDLTVRTYSTTVKSAVPVVKIYFYKNLKKLRRVESVYSERNAMYATARKLRLEFADIHDESALIRYTVKGFQKTMLNDSAVMSIEGWIKYSY